VEARIREEVAEGNYLVTPEDSVTLISPLATIDKPDGDIRLLHDLSFPKNHGLNSYALKEDCHYEGIRDALQTLKPGMFLAKCDLKSAFRSVPVCENHQKLTGLQWTFQGDKKPTTLVDSALCMGSRKAPAHFNRISKAIKRMMVRRGYNCTVMLDDFLLHEASFEKCALALATLIALLRSLGLKISWPKVSDPTKKLVFLGYLIDTEDNKLSLDPAKITQTMDNLQVPVSKTWISCKQIEKLAGRLIWAVT
jgi:hypothetical protein